LKELPCN